MKSVRGIGDGSALMVGLPILVLKQLGIFITAYVLEVLRGTFHLAIHFDSRIITLSAGQILTRENALRENRSVLT
jgi:hypothetical protein